MLFEFHQTNLNSKKFQEESHHFEDTVARHQTQIKSRNIPDEIGVVLLLKGVDLVP